MLLPLLSLEKCHFISSVQYNEPSCFHLVSRLEPQEIDSSRNMAASYSAGVIPRRQFRIKHIFNKSAVDIVDGEINMTWGLKGEFHRRL